MKTLAAVKQWLVTEIKTNDEVVNGTVVMSDNSYDIYVGRMECAEMLLKLIEEGEVNDDITESDYIYRHWKKESESYDS